MFPAVQSAYRKHYSIETTLLRVTDGILKTLHWNSGMVLVLLNPSTAFDTLDHQILLARLHTYFTDTALKWLSSYLLDRSQKVLNCIGCNIFTSLFRVWCPSTFVSHYYLLSIRHLYSMLCIATGSTSCLCRQHPNLYQQQEPYTPSSLSWCSSSLHRWCLCEDH